MSIIPFGTITSTVDGAELQLGEAMAPISLTYTSQDAGSGSGSPGVAWSTHPALPAGMSISNGEISGTPSVYASNQTYTIYANQSGVSTTYDLSLASTMLTHTQ